MLPAKGHTVVLGTAGSGKTTLAVLRSVYLADPHTAHSGRTLLVTFNTTLVSYLRHLQDFPANVTVEHYHKFARGYLNARGKMKYNCIVRDGAVQEELIRRATAEVAKRHKPHSFFQRQSKQLADEVRWIQHHGLRERKDYVETDRIGRAEMRIAKAHRPLMFEIYEEYQSIRSAAGKLYDWDDIATSVNAELEADDTKRMYRHVVIDEGQDLSPEMIRSLANAIPPDGSLTYFGDSAQQIYGHRTSWRSAGLSVKKVWEFEHNYRNSAEIAGLALAISKMPQYTDVHDLVTPVTPTAKGPLPTLVKCASTPAQIALVLQQAQTAARGTSVGLLFRDHDDEERIVSLLKKIKGLRLQKLDREIGRWVAGPGIYHGTYFGAKGLEFDVVILPFLDSGRLPDAEAIKSFGLDEASAKAIRQLYVGVTRAKTRLVMTYTETLTKLCPTTDGLFQILSYP